MYSGTVQDRCSHLLHLLPLLSRCLRCKMAGPSLSGAHRRSKCLRHRPRLESSHAQPPVSAITWAPLQVLAPPLQVLRSSALVHPQPNDAKRRCIARHSEMCEQNGTNEVVHATGRVQTAADESADADPLFVSADARETLEL